VDSIKLYVQTKVVFGYEEEKASSAVKPKEETPTTITKTKSHAKAPVVEQQKTSNLNSEM